MEDMNVQPKSPDYLKPKVALITGASSGIGLNLARLFAKKRYNLVLVARREERLNAISEKLKESYNIDCQVIKADLSLAKGLKKLMSGLEEKGISVDLLINCAGILHVNKAQDIELKNDISLIYTNLISPIELSKYCVRKWTENGKKGSIINISSMAALCPHPYMATYSASKAGLYHYSLAMAAELRHKGVYILTACPGPTDTDLINKNDLSYPKAKVAEVANDIVQAYDQKREVVITNRFYKMLHFLSLLMPKFCKIRSIARIMEKRSQIRTAS